MNRPPLPFYAIPDPSREERIAAVLARGIGMAIAMSLASVLAIEVWGAAW